MTTSECGNPAATCQQGICCSGVVTKGDCHCGDGPGCDVYTATCCVTGPQVVVPTCVKYGYQCYQSPK